MLKGLTEEQRKRKIVHPDRRVFVLDATLAWATPPCPHAGIAESPWLDISAIGVAPSSHCLGMA
jgi:hypothetical protein